MGFFGNKKEEDSQMIISTTDSLDTHDIIEYKGIVTGEVIVGANFIKDYLANIRDVVGGRSGSYEKVFNNAKDDALQEMKKRAEEMGANAIVGVDLDYETMGEKNSIIMVTASGTGVVITR